MNARVTSWARRAAALLKRDDVAVPLAVFVGSRALIYGLLVVFTGLLPNITRGRADFWFLMRRWDGDWYFRVADDGYVWQGAQTQTTAGFFPFFPLIGSILGWPFGDVRWGLLIAVNLSFAIFLYCFYAWARAIVGGDVAQRSVIYAAAFPAAFVTASFYSEATVMACAAATLLFLERKRYGLAIGAAFLGALTRLPALALVFVLALEFARLRQWRWLAAALIIVPLGPVLFSAYLWMLSGDPFAYFNIQRIAWFHEFHWPWDTLRIAFERLSWMPASYATAVSFLEVGSIVLFALLAVGVWRRRPFGEFLYVLAVLGMTLVQTVDLSKGTPTQSAPRYLMAALPCFLALGMAGGNRALDALIRWIFVGLQAVFALYFFAGFWVV
jgi:hypothetical protein